MKQPELYFQYQQSTHSDYEKAGVDRSKWFVDESFGYNLEQGTVSSTPPCVAMKLSV